MNYDIKITRTAKKDIEALSPKLRRKLKRMLVEIAKYPKNCGKKLAGRLEGKYSLRLTYRDRIVWSIDESKSVIYIERAKTHYGE